MDPERTRETNIFFMRREIEDARRRMRSRLRDQRLSDEDRERIARRYQQDIERRARDLERYERESVVHPNLAAGGPGIDFSDLVPPAPAQGANGLPPGFQLDQPR